MVAIGEVTAEALLKRVNRALKPKGKRVRKTRGEAQESDLGEHYIESLETGNVLSLRANIVEMAREIGVLEDYEEVTWTDKDGNRFRYHGDQILSRKE